MFRQTAILLLVIVTVLFVGHILLYLKPKSSVTVHFKEGITPKEITGEVIKKDRFIVITPDDGSPEQVFTWDQIRNISGTESGYTKRINDVADLLELVAKLGILAAAGVFLIGLYQFDIGQKWKQEEFLAGTVKDFGGRLSVENAKKMLELLMFYEERGRDIPLYTEDPTAEWQRVEVENIRRALDPALTNELSEDEKRIRECFDAFFSRLERFEHYIESRLITEKSVGIYLSFWIDALRGKDRAGKGPLLKDKYRAWLMGYIEHYEFPMLERLLERFSRDRSLLGRLKRLLSRFWRPRREKRDRGGPPGQAGDVSENLPPPEKQVGPGGTQPA